MQNSLIPIKILHEVDASSEGFDGVDLKRLAKCDDGNTYAIKRVEDHPLMPICEWVGHHFCRACGVLTPDFAILHAADNSTVKSFGSRISSFAQIEHDPVALRISSFFHGHYEALSRVYSIDAFLVNPDRHGRNLFVRSDSGGTALLAFDYSSGWLRTGEPFGNQERMRDSHTFKWWRTFKRLGAGVDKAALDKIASLNANWLEQVLNSSPTDWRNQFNEADVLQFWSTSRRARLEWAELWLT
jgi:hypothetical protein